MKKPVKLAVLGILIVVAGALWTNRLFGTKVLHEVQVNERVRAVLTDADCGLMPKDAAKEARKIGVLGGTGYIDGVAVELCWQDQHDGSAFVADANGNSGFVFIGNKKEAPKTKIEDGPASGQLEVKAVHGLRG